MSQEPEEPEHNRILEAVDELHRLNQDEDEAIQALEREVHPALLSGEVLQQLNRGQIRDLSMLKRDVGAAR